ncbi:MAG: hypothetical protein R6X29_10415 [Acidimicrobiia bacterium]|jgi:hypothetical protein
MGRTLVALLLAAAFVAGCGGGEADPAPGGDAGNDTTSTTGASNSGDGAGSSGTGPANFAVVTVGDVVYEFPADPVNGCNNLGNVIGASYAIGADGSPVEAGGPEVAVQFNFIVPEVDWEAQGLQAPSLTLDDYGNGVFVRWQAGGFDDIEGVFEVWELSNGRAQGTVTFIDYNAHTAGEETEPVPGSFEILCNP